MENQLGEIPRRYWVGWATILLLAAALRLSGLGHCPDGLFRDEAEKGYNAWALAHSGGVIEFPAAGSRETDKIRFRRWPLHVEVMGVTTSAIYQYASIPFVKLFGLNAASARMASAWTGTLTVAVLGLILLRAWPARFALSAMAWLALCPWHYIFSRWALQGVFVPLGMTAALAGGIGVERERRWGFPLLGAALGFIFYAYSGAQPFALAWGLGAMVIYRRQIRARGIECAGGILLFLFLAGPTIWITLFGSGAARLNSVALWNAPDASFGTNVARFVASYLAHFNPWFLFVSGDSLPRHAIPGLGQLLLADVIFLPLGFIAAIKNRLAGNKLLLLAFFLGPLGAAITWGHIPHALRAIPMLLPAAVWGGVGLAAAAHWTKTKVSSSEEEGGRRGAILALLIWAAASAYACRVYGVYRAVFSPGAEATQGEEGFAAECRAAFETAMKSAKPGSIIYVNAFIPYAPYYALFFGVIDPSAAAEHGLESPGPNSPGFVFFDPRVQNGESLASLISAGGEIIDFDHNGVPIFISAQRGGSLK
ncbi:hypothetical protein HY256_11280 [Candidatus Sumerlaeota bacterium]|nr:hypothetical protein [Candidatus Sumerlaeota bacterium]